MRPKDKLKRVKRAAWPGRALFGVARFGLALFGLALFALALVAGCGLPGTPLPPTLRLPRPVHDLAAARTGNVVTLVWTMPKRDTSKVLLRPNVAVPARVCRRENAAGACATVADLAFPPGASGSFSQVLPAALATGSPRLLYYFVELRNESGRSAGLSNSAAVLAGQAPAPVTGLTAAVRKDGIVLRWTPGPPEPYPTGIRLERALLTPPPSKPATGPLAAPLEPARQELLVPTGIARGGALDKDIRFGETYSYRAQRVARIEIGGKAFQLDGALSPPVRVDAENVFAPSVPTGLAAVATPAQNGAGPSIDLSWLPDTESDLAGYAVYRRTGQTQSPAPWRRISGARPVAGPGYHDADVRPGVTYQYAVTAIGENGRESAKSAPAKETVPEPQQQGRAESALH